MLLLQKQTPDNTLIKNSFNDSFKDTFTLTQLKIITLIAFN